MKNILLSYISCVMIATNIAQAQTKMPRGTGGINIDLSKGLNTKEYKKKVKEKVRSLDPKSVKKEVKNEALSVVASKAKNTKLDQVISIQHQSIPRYNQLKTYGWDSLALSKVNLVEINQTLYNTGLSEFSGDINTLIVFRDEIADLIYDDSTRLVFLKNLDPGACQQRDSLGSNLHNRGLLTKAGENTIASQLSGIEGMDILTENSLSEQLDFKAKSEQLLSPYGVAPENLNFSAPEKLGEEAMELARSKYNDHFAEHPQAIDVAQSSLLVVRKKRTLKDFISELANQEIESMKEMELRERFSVGGNLQLQRNAHSTTLDMSPSLGYKLTGKVSAHVGGMYRSVLEKNTQNVGDKSDDVLGYRFFLNYKFIYSTYFQFEYESLRSRFSSSSSDSYKDKWSKGYLIGLGKNFSLSQMVQGSVLFLYDFNHTNKAPYHSPWRFRFGFQI